MGTVIYGEAERAIQRELVAMARVLEAERRRARKLLRQLQGLASYKAMEDVGDDEIGLHVAGDIAGALEIAAGDLAENVASLRLAAKATPERLAAGVAEARRTQAPLVVKVPLPPMTLPTMTAEQQEGARLVLDLLSGRLKTHLDLPA